MAQGYRLLREIPDSALATVTPEAIGVCRVAAPRLQSASSRAPLLRQERHERIRNGQLPGFLDETAEIRSS